MALGLSPKQGQLERLLELAAGIGFDNKPVNPQEEALIHMLLSVCTRRSTSDGNSTAIDALGGGDITLNLLHLCASTSGVPQSLALHALKTWTEDHEGSLHTCIGAGGIPILLSLFASSLPASAADVAAAYSASLTVILLRSLVRVGGDEAASAFLAAQGLNTLINLLTNTELDNRSLCLVLYLMNDVTRRSSELLDKAIEINAVAYVVSVLSQPISEATKFASLILNRWSLAAQHLPTIRGAGSSEALLRVLEESCGSLQQSADPETTAYTLSAFAIINQDAVDALRARLLSSPTSLVAISRAVELYERCFKGVGFPHALMCMLIDGPEGASLVAALAARGLLPLWLAARHVGLQVSERAVQPDVLAALTAFNAPEETLEVTLALTHLLQVNPSPTFIKLLVEDGRLEGLTLNAITELLSTEEADTAPNSNTASIPTAAVCDGFLPLSPAGSSGMEAWGNAGSGGFKSNENRKESESCTAAAAVEDPHRLQMTLSMNSSVALPPPSALTKTDKAAEGCLAALTRLAIATRESTDADYEMETSSAKRQKIEHVEHQQPLIFRREDVGVPRYDTLCFVVGGREVHAVGFVLENYSVFLRGLLSTVSHVGERVVVPQLAAFTVDSMYQLFIKAVEWCYVGQVENLNASAETAFDLWALAEFLQIDGLQRYCEASIENWFATQQEIIIHSLRLAEAYPSAAPLRCRVARHVLALLVDRERSTSVVAAAAAAGQAADLGVAVAVELRERLSAATSML